MQWSPDRIVLMQIFYLFSTYCVPSPTQCPAWLRRFGSYRDLEKDFRYVNKLTHNSWQRNKSSSAKWEQKKEVCTSPWSPHCTPGQGIGITGFWSHYVQCWTWHPLATRQAGVMKPKISASVEARFWVCLQGHLRSAIFGPCLGLDHTAPTLGWYLYTVPSCGMEENFNFFFLAYLNCPIFLHLTCNYNSWRFFEVFKKHHWRPWIHLYQCFTNFSHL